MVRANKGPTGAKGIFARPFHVERIFALRVPLPNPIHRFGSAEHEKNHKEDSSFASAVNIVRSDKIGEPVQRYLEQFHAREILIRRQPVLDESVNNETEH